MPQSPVPDVPTQVPGLVLGELTLDDADAYYALLDRNRERLSRLGNYRAESEATPAWVREHLSEVSGLSRRCGIRLNSELIGRSI